MESSDRLNRRSALRRELTDRFSESDLRDICFDLKIDYGDFPGISKAEKARELILYCERKNRIPELVDSCKTVHPEIAWDELFTALSKEANSEESGTRESSTGTSAANSIIPKRKSSFERLGEEDNPVTIWLRVQGFNTNPFGSVDAADEEDWLPSFFVRVPFFNTLVGDPENPQHVILFAPRGSGKTSHCLEIARRAREYSSCPALSVIFTGFGNKKLWEPLPTLNTAPSTTIYTDIVLSETLDTLKDVWQSHPQQLAELKSNQERYTEYSALTRLYASPDACIVSTDALTKEWVNYYTQHPPDLARSRQRLSAIARQAGFASIYFLIDGVDEFAETRNSPETALALIQPLLEASGAARQKGFAFKFFLPKSLEQIMLDRNIGRLDRIKSYSLEWSEDDLRQMLSQRLTSYSRISETDSRGTVDSFSTLCEGEDKVDDWLVEAARGSPRTLLRIAREIIERHCHQHTDNENRLVSVQTIEAVLKNGNWKRA